MSRKWTTQRFNPHPSLAKGWGCSKRLCLPFQSQFECIIRDMLRLSLAFNNTLNTSHIWPNSPDYYKKDKCIWFQFFPQTFQYNPDGAWELTDRMSGNLPHLLFPEMLNVSAAIKYGAQYCNIWSENTILFPCTYLQSSGKLHKIAQMYLSVPSCHCSKY